jgi:hypothetical protein
MLWDRFSGRNKHFPWHDMFREPLMLATGPETEALAHRIYNYAVLTHFFFYFWLAGGGSTLACKFLLSILFGEVYHSCSSSFLKLQLRDNFPISAGRAEGKIMLC